MRPALEYAPEMLLKAQGVRVALFDVDGVFTDGGLHFTAAGETTKRFHTLDGYGLKLLAGAGIEPVVISGRDSKALRTRLKALGIGRMLLGADDKLAAANRCLETIGAGWEHAAAIGDDWPDLPLLRRCAFSAAPPNAHVEVRAVVDFVTTRAGGDGAVREFCDLLLVASGRYAGLLESAAG